MVSAEVTTTYTWRHKGGPMDFRFPSFTAKANPRYSFANRSKLIVNTMHGSICGVHIVELKTL